MSVKESSATALVRFTGLGIVCFNKDKQRGEIGAIRDNKHTLTIKVQKPVYQEGADGDVIVYQDIATYENLPKDDVQIEIKATNPAIAYHRKVPSRPRSYKLPVKYSLLSASTFTVTELTVYSSVAPSKFA